MKAMILSAGRGERMRPLTDRQPKPLLKVGGKSLLEHHIEALKRAGITELVINHAWCGDKIIAKLGTGKRYGVSIHYSSEQPTALETGGGILQALPLLGDAPFLVVSGDIFTDYDFSQLANIQPAPETLAHLVLADNPVHHPHGDFHLDDQNNHQTEKSRKISLDGASKLTYSGISLLRPELFNDCDPGAFPLRIPLRKAIRNGTVTGEHHPGFWSDVGTPERLTTLQQNHF